MAGACRRFDTAMRIAVVEDDHCMAMLLAYNLEAAGYHVEIIGSGVEALARLSSSPVDLVVLDWGLPGLSGIELLRQLRHRLAPLHIPVIMLTGRTGSEDRARSMRTGADVFLSKPFAMAELMARVHDLLEIHGRGIRGGTEPDDGDAAAPRNRGSDLRNAAPAHFPDCETQSAPPRTAPSLPAPPLTGPSRTARAWPAGPGLHRGGRRNGPAHA